MEKGELANLCSVFPGPYAHGTPEHRSRAPPSLGSIIQSRMPVAPLPSTNMRMMTEKLTFIFNLPHSLTYKGEGREKTPWEVYIRI